MFFSSRLLGSVVLLLLLPAPVIADDDPINIVQGVYGRVLKPIVVDKQGRQLCVLRDKPEYRQEDFTPELYQLIVDANQTFVDFQAGKRKNFWDAEVLTGDQSNNLTEWPKLQIVSQTTDRVVVKVVSAGRGFYHLNGQWDGNVHIPYSWQVVVVRKNDRWQFADVLGATGDSRMTGLRKFLDQK